MKLILSLLLAIGTPCLLFGQFNKFEISDSLFKCYKAPAIESNVLDRLDRDDAIIYIGCYYTTDTTGRITSEKYIPFIEIGNNYIPLDSIWQSIRVSLTRASKDWIFKPILWELEGDEYEEKVLNKRAFQRPFNGKPNYFIVFEVSGIELSLIHKVSYIRNLK